jgi:hypothetical protein
VSYVTQGGVSSVRVTTGPTCAWTAASSDSWITITSAACVYVNDVLRVDETKRTLPFPGQRHALRIGIYNAFRSGANEPYDTQVVYFDGIRKSIR